MRIGMLGGTIDEGTIDDVVAEARRAGADGSASCWVPQMFGHNALTAPAIVGREVSWTEPGASVVPTFPRHPMRGGAAGREDIAIIGSEAEVVERVSALAEVGVTEFAAVEFPGDADEAASTRAAMQAVMS